MVLPLQIRIIDHEVRLTAAAVPYGVSLSSELEFAFLVDVDGEMVVMSPYEFACRDASCRPPGSGGTGGSNPGGGSSDGGFTIYKNGKRVPTKAKRKLGETERASFGTHSEGKAAKAADLKMREAKQRLGDKDPEFLELEEAAKHAFTRAVITERTSKRTVTDAAAMTDNQLDLIYPHRHNPGVTYADGTLGIPGMDEFGNPLGLSAEQEAATTKGWTGLGPPKQVYEDNLTAVGKLAMGIDLKTGTVALDASGNPTPEALAIIAKGNKIALWYSDVHALAQTTSDETGLPLEAIVAGLTVMSAGRQWSGAKSGNQETGMGLAKLVVKPIDVTITPTVIAFMNWRREKATKVVGQVGLDTSRLKPGKKVNTNDLDSATLAEVLYAINTTRGHTSFEDWAAKTTDARGRIGWKESKEQKATESPFPFFGPKGTLQVKQALGFMRQEVTPRQGIEGPKYSSFFSNILVPTKNGYSTNDVWQYRITSGNQILTSKGKKGKPDVRGTMKELTLGKDPVDSAQGLMQQGGNAEHGMYRDSTQMLAGALARNKLTHPEIFGNMTKNQYQALVWLHIGGGLQNDDVRTAKWDGALAAMREVGL